MNRFIIDRENRIERTESGPDAEADTRTGERFNNLKELRNLTREWPLARLVGVWNSLPGVTRLRRFTDRKTGIARIWKALEKTDRSPTRSQQRHPTRATLAGTKKAKILALLKRRQGATLKETHQRLAGALGPRLHQRPPC